MPTTKRKLKTECARLSACLARKAYPEPVREIAGNVITGIDAAQIGARVHPEVKVRLLADVAALEKVLGEAR